MRSFKAGYDAGHGEGSVLGYEEGYGLAQVEAVKIGKDIGWMLASLRALRNDTEAVGSGSWKKVDRLLESIRAIPLENVETDREAMVAKVKAKYRELCQAFPQLAPLSEVARPLEF